MTRLIFLLICPAAALAAEAPKESDYYPIGNVPNPDNYVLEVGALEHAPDGTIYAATRRGEIYRVTGTLDADLSTAKITPFAKGLHETLGAAWRDGALYVQQRGEITRLKDEDGDGRADTFDTVSDQFGLSGDYHEYAFSSRADKNGDIWSVFCLTGSFTSNVLWRGWAVTTNPKTGQTTPVCSGIRSPGGIGFNAAGDVFYTDNQGPWNGSSSLKWLKPGSFQGHSETLRWYDRAPGMQKPLPPQDQSRTVKEQARNPLYVPPAVVLPHGRVGQSPTAIVCDTTGGKFGPFQNQLFVADQCYSNITRCCLEKVEGLYQGAAIPFVEGFGSGIIGMVLTPDGKMFAGGSDRGWGARGGKPFNFDRLVWTGRTPFEILDMKAQSHGFLLTFTQPLDKTTAARTDSYKMEAWTWAFRAEYGGPEVDRVTPVVHAADVSADGLSVQLRIQGLVKGHVHHLKSPGVRSAEGQPLLHTDAYYTLNNIPAN